jgi:glycosyltransferase involved in cell wall biosynthesis
VHLYFYLKHFSNFAKRLSEGTTKAVHGLASGIVAAGGKVTVLCEGPEEINERTPEGYTVECYVNCNGCKFILARGLKDRLREIAALKQNSIFVLNGMFHPSVYMMSRILRRHDLPYVISPHDPYHPAVYQRRPLSKLVYWHLFERPMLRQAAAVQLLDRRHGTYLRERGVDVSTITVANGFEEHDVAEASSLTWNTSGPIKLGYLGRLDSHNKGLDLLIDSMPKVIAKTADPVSLELRGPDAGDRAALEARATAKRLPIHFTQPDYSVRPSSILAQLDILCLPSRFEGFGLVALEAMIAGRPVLVAETAGIAPHVERAKCGIVVPATVEGVEKGILQLISRRAEWREMGLRGRTHVLRHMDWRSLGIRSLKLYTRLSAMAARREQRKLDANAEALISCSSLSNL